jgi:hypothetical protein
VIGWHAPKEACKAGEMMLAGCLRLARCLRFATSATTPPIQATEHMMCGCGQVAVGIQLKCHFPPRGYTRLAPAPPWDILEIACWIRVRVGG